MILQTNPFSQLQSEDKQLLHILQSNFDHNSSYVADRQCFLQQLNSQSLSPKFPTIYHNLLPSEIHTPCISTSSMSNLTKQVEVSSDRCLNINNRLSPSQQVELVTMLQGQKSAFAWDYGDMKGIDPFLYTHRIYIKKDCLPVRQPQRKINPTLREIVKTELQKLLDVGFIYPISDSQWVSPLVIVPKKDGK
jgi:hypothetical protein